MIHELLKNGLTLEILEQLTYKSKMEQLTEI